ncbi:MAG TPA: hypothetical protein VMV92_39710 [Streptosporangiaceae bacterium]|nr:hypothetical protein [Streptosporangiaceae bacterium]
MKPSPSWPCVHGIFEWHHEIDLSSPARPDAAILEWTRGLLVERGVHDDYVEHWRRAIPAAGPCWELRLTDRRGRGRLSCFGLAPTLAGRPARIRRRSHSPASATRQPRSRGPAAHPGWEHGSAGLRADPR